MKTILIKLCLMVFVIDQISCAIPLENQYKNKIITNITSGYNNAIRPSEKIRIDIKLSLKQISSLDEKNQILTTNSYFACFWSDSRLTWDPEDYGNVTFVLIQASKLWMPDCKIDLNLFYKDCKNDYRKLLLPSALSEDFCKWSGLFFRL
jgi:hypothetical protein